MASKVKPPSPNESQQFFFEGLGHNDAPEFPFKCSLSLEPLIAFWEKQVLQLHPSMKAIVEKVHHDLKKAPELCGPIEDLSILEKHQELVEILMGVVFPIASRQSDFAAACVPFNLQIFFETPPLKRLNVNGILWKLIDIDPALAARGKMLKAYVHIAKQLYGLDFDFEYPMTFTAKDERTGLSRYYGFHIDPQFVEIRFHGELKPLSDEDKNRLRANLMNLSVWKEVIPPQFIEFRGFTVIHAHDVTNQEVISSLKRDLIEKESIISNSRFNFMQEKLRTYLRKPDLILGLVAIQGEQVLPLNYGSQVDWNCDGRDVTQLKISDYGDSIYGRASIEKRVLVVDDLQAYPNRTWVEDEILQHGIRNIVIAPLFDQDKLIGTFELGSPNPGDMTSINVLSLHEILPLFAMAIRRNLDELNTQVQAVIKEKCTAIHPSVEWRFRRAAFEYLNKQKSCDMVEMAPIVFDEVYPLFGLSDIRSSSIQRNAAIQADLLDNLTLIKNIIALAYDFRPMPFLHELIYRVDKFISMIDDGLHTGDEASTLDFLRREVEPLFNTLQEYDEDIRARIENYRAAVDPHLGMVYKRRKDFEESVTLMSESISAYIDEEQESSQAMFPHYFEKHKSDGVDHGIYVGASLVESGKFDLLYLKNLRLWQLLVLCGSARKAEELKSRLKVPLEATHLILVQHMPLSIRFRYDEKHFDVDGAYNIRYEIMKKRIDKAIIKGRSERLTQPGKIAIVYSQPREAVEYRRYIEYLQHYSYLTDDVEEFELEELQGIQGLRALRVTVDVSASEQKSSFILEKIAETVHEMN